MKKIIKDKFSIVVLSISLLCILATSVFGYLVSPFYKEDTSKFALVLVLGIVFALASIACEIIFIRKSEFYKKSLLIYGLICLFVGIINTIVFKIISVVSKDSVWNLTGFKSVIFLFSFYTAILLVSLFPIKKLKEDKVLNKEEI